MELSHSLLLNEEALAQIADQKKPVFIYEWLRFLDRVLPVAQKSDIKGCQPKLVEQLTGQILNGVGPATRKLLARCLATLFSVGDTFSLFQTINVCNDLIKNKDDSPTILPSKLAAVSCLGAMYEKLGRMVGRSFEETTQILIKSLKNAESHGRIETMLTFDKMVIGLGSGGFTVRKEIYKAAKLLLTDRVMSVRSAAATCLMSLTKESTLIFTHELENICASCFKSFEGSNYDVRCSVARLLGLVLAAGHNPKLACLPKTSGSAGSAAATQITKPLTLDECWAIIASGFLRGGLGFFRGGAGVAGNIPKDVRIGVTMAYVEFVECLGPAWLERNSSAVLRHFLDLAASAGKAGTSLSQQDVLYVRNCCRYIIRQTFGKILNEKSQISTCKEIGILIAEHMNTVDLSMDSSLDRTLTPELSAGRELATVALIELAHLVTVVGSAVAPLFVEASGIMEPVFAVLLHPCLACRSASAWCLRAIASVVPSLLTPLIDRCLNRLEHQKSVPDAVSGYSLALAALLSTVHRCPLGIPQSKGKQIFAAAEELLRTASQSSRLTLVKTQAGWLLLSALPSLGPAVVKSLLPKLILLWKNAFPRSSKEAESEKNRGDLFTWQVTLESRAGALAAMQYFLAYCREIATDDVIRRILGPIDAALAMFGILPQVVKQTGSQLKAPASLVRYRLYKTLLQCTPKQFEGSFAALLRELVADFTLTENPTVIQCTVTSNLCHPDSNTVLGVWFHDANHKMIEDEVLPAHHSYPSALENDLYRLCARNSQDDTSYPVNLEVVDHSILLYGAMFPCVPTKHRLQMLDHFNECIKQAKGTRQQAIQMNVLTALLCSLKAVSDNKTTLDNELVVKSALNLILPPLAGANMMLRLAGAEALGRCAQVVSEPRFVAEMAQYCFDKLKSCRDVVSRTGHSLALGCLHRYVGGLGSGQHLNTSVGVLLALAQDFSSPIVQVWALHALGLIAAGGGPMFRGYVDPALALCLKIMLTVPASSGDVCQCVGKLMGSLIITVGPEMQNNIGNIVTTRNSFLAACSIMTEHPDPAVRAEAISCAQQVHLFAARHVNLSILVPQLCASLKSDHVMLRKASVACLRQLVQREAKEVREHAQSLIPQGLQDKKTSLLPETGLEGALFHLMDLESDSNLILNVKETLSSLVQCLATDYLTHYLMLCKDILAATASDILSPMQEEKIVRSASGLVSADTDAGDEQREEDAIKIGSVDEDLFSRMVPRYLTRVFAVEVVRKIITLCENERAHFDLALAKELQLSGGKRDFLVLHLSDLVRMSFMAATSNNIDSRLAGLACLQDVITNFAKAPEPEFPGHVILEQFQAQVGAALRPAFTPETPSHVTAAACQVCSTWIGSGVARDLNDLRRVHQLLASSLAKLKKGSISTQLYNESAATLEKLAILKAWAEVYIVAMKQDSDSKEKQLKRKSSAGAAAESSGEDLSEAAFESGYYQSESLLQLVTPELSSLIDSWLSALRDYALLTLPPEFAPQLPADGGTYFTPDSAESVRIYYKNSWSPILLAASTWLKANNFELPLSDTDSFDEDVRRKVPTKLTEENKEDRFSLILGTCMEALCSPRSADNLDTVNLCLESLRTVLECEWGQLQLTADPQLAVEVLNVMHRLILTRESLAIQISCMEVVNKVLQACESSIRMVTEAESDEGVEPDPNPNLKLPSNQYSGQEGGDSGKVDAGKSVVYAALEVCLCQLVRQIPQVNPATMKSKAGVLTHRKYSRLTSAESQQLVTMALKCLVRLTSFCSSKGLLTVLPTVLFLIIGVLRETSKLDKSHFGAPTLPGVVSPPAAAALQGLRTLVNRPVMDADGSAPDSDWVRIVQCAVWSTVSLVDKDMNSDLEMDKGVVLLAVAVFLVASPSQVVTTPNLQQACIDLFKSSLSDECFGVQLKCLQTLQSIFSVKDSSICVPFIQALTPLIMLKFKYFVADLTPDGDKIRIPDERTELPTLIEAERALESVLAAALRDKRLPLVVIVVQILMSFVSEVQPANPNLVSKQLHEYALSRLNKLGPAYPDEFKILLTRSPTLKVRLENAVRACQQQQMASRMNAKGQISNRASNSMQPANQPAIKLTMDFSSFIKE